MTRIAVVIPTLNEAVHLPRILADLTCDIIADIIVTDGGSTDHTIQIAEAAGAEIITGPPGRGGQLRRGITAASVPWLLLLHADSTLHPGWQEAITTRLNNADGSCAFYGRLRFAGANPRARLLEALVHLRCAVLRLPYGDQALLIHRDLLASVGGIPDLPLMEDVALARILGRRRLAPMAITVKTDAIAYQRDGWLRRSLSNQWRLLRFLAGVPAAHLASRYRR